MSTALKKWISAAADDFKILGQKRDADGPMQDRALEIVRKFIIERKLILYGGLAIDYALRLRGSHIYPDDERPDFDVFSSRNVEDAYDLADRLHQAGFENVGAIRAIHVQTMRVKTDFIFVADISYAAPDVFAQMPFVMSRGIQVLHPDYQRMDMHLAFCFPFGGAPREDVFHRWKKDVRRFNLLSEIYPIVVDTDLTDKSMIDITVTAGAPTAAAAEPTQIKAIIPIDVAIHGYAAYGLLRAALDELMASTGVEIKTEAPPMPIEVKQKLEQLEIAFLSPIPLPKGTPPPPKGTPPLPLVVVSPNPEKTVGELGGVAVWYDPYMDARPRMAQVEVGGSVVCIHSSKNRLLSIAMVGPTRVVSPQALLLYFLFEAHHAATPVERKTATNFYCWTLSIINAAAEVLSRVEVKLDVAPSIRKFLNSCPFFLSTRTLGDVNHDASYMIKMARVIRDVKDTPPASLQLDPDLPKLLDGLPTDYFPGKKKRAEFDYGSNVLFRRSGLRSW